MLSRSPVEKGFLRKSTISYIIIVSSILQISDVKPTGRLFTQLFI